jgi:cyd operon protein YbgT
VYGLESKVMWYFTWILGVLLACSFGIVNAMWLELNEDLDRGESLSGIQSGDKSSETSVQDSGDI